eukprot:29282-Pelagococcus_subviridis.AAC.12
MPRVPGVQSRGVDRQDVELRLVRVERVRVSQPERVRDARAKYQVHELDEHVAQVRVLRQEQQDDLHQNRHAHERKHVELKPVVDYVLHLLQRLRGVHIRLAHHEQLRLELAHVPRRPRERHRDARHVTRARKTRGSAPQSTDTPRATPRARPSRLRP